MLFLRKEGEGRTREKLTDNFSCITNIKQVLEKRIKNIHKIYLYKGEIPDGFCDFARQQLQAGGKDL